MAYKEEEYLQISGLQHFAFCRRQWALAYIEMQWVENVLTTEGHILHERAHDENFTEKRKDILVTRGMRVSSSTLGVSGTCDIVEFHVSDTGVPLFGRAEKWLPLPVEYKRGAPKVSDADRLQLCCQAMCLEEMLLCPRIETGDIYYGETRRREHVLLDDPLRNSVKNMLEEMHQLDRKQHTPKVKMTKSCNACSLKNLCLPKIAGKNVSVKNYIEEELKAGQ